MWPAAEILLGVALIAGAVLVARLLGKGDGKTGGEKGGGKNPGGCATCTGCGKCGKWWK